MLRIGIIAVLMIVPSYLMPVKKSGDAAIFEDDIIIKAQPKPTIQPFALNIIEEHVMIRKKRESENLPSSADKSSLYGDETHWWKNQKTSAPPIVNDMNRKHDQESTVAEDNIMMKAAPVSDGLSVVEDNIMMRDVNIFEDNIAMKQDDKTLNVFEDNIIMRRKRESELDTGVNPTSALPIDKSVDQVNSVYEDNVMFRKQDASPKNVAASENVFEDQVMMKKQPNTQVANGSSEKASYVFEDHVIMRKDPETTTKSVETQDPSAQVANGASGKASNVFEDHFIMREVAETTTRSAETQDATNPKAAVIEDNLVMRSDSKNTVDSPSQKDAVIEDEMVLRQNADDDKTNDSFVTEDHVMFRTSNGNSDTEVGTNQQSLIIIEDHLLRKRDESPKNVAASENVFEDQVMMKKQPNAQVANGASEKASYVFEDHFIMRVDPETTTKSVETQDATNPKAAVFEDNIMMRSDSKNTVDSPSQKDSVFEDEMVLRQNADDDKTKDSFVTEDHVILRTSNETEVETADTGVGTNQQSLIVIEDHLIRKREVANNDAKDSVFEDHFMLRSGTTQSSTGSAAEHEKDNQQSFIVIDDHLLR